MNSRQADRFYPPTGSSPAMTAPIAFRQKLAGNLWKRYIYNQSEAIVKGSNSQFVVHSSMKETVRSVLSKAMNKFDLTADIHNKSNHFDWFVFSLTAIHRDFWVCNSTDKFIWYFCDWLARVVAPEGSFSQLVTLRGAPKWKVDWKALYAGQDEHWLWRGEGLSTRPGAFEKWEPRKMRTDSHVYQTNVNFWFSEPVSEVLYWAHFHRDLTFELFCQQTQM